MAGTSKTPIEVFLSYSHVDKRLVDRFKPHLTSLERQKVITNWYDADIHPGSPWDEEIKQHLRSAQIILLLVSPDFMASPYINNIEIRQAMKRHRRGEARVIPILLREVDWSGAPFSKLQGLPDGLKAVVKWKDRDSAFRNITDGIRKTVNSLQQVQPAAGDLPLDYYFLNHSSFLRRDKQKEFQEITGIPIDHYDIRVVVDSFWEGALDRVRKVVYFLDPTYPQHVYIRTSKDRGEKFLLKELANGEYVLKADVYIRGRREPIRLHRYLTLWKSGPELP